MGFFPELVYGLFLSVSRITIARTMMINTNSPAIAGTKYMSAADAGGAGVGLSWAVGSSYAMEVCAVEPKYELDPPNAAIILYVPGTLGV